MLTDDEVGRFHADGFVKGGRVLGEAEVETLRAELARVIEDRDRADVPQPVRLANLSGDEGHPVWQIVNIWQASKPFSDLIHNEQIIEELAQLTAAHELRLWHDQIQYKPAEQGGVNHWHQDAPLWPVLRPMTQVTAWVALDDVDISNGCMSMVPGSHLWGDQIAYLTGLEGFELPTEYEGHRVEAVPRPVAKGEVHYHHALTWHGSHQNSSNRPRRAIAIHTMSDETVFRAAGEHIMKQYITVADGETVAGEAFPLLYNG